VIPRIRRSLPDTIVIFVDKRARTRVFRRDKLKRARPRTFSAVCFVKAKQITHYATRKAIGSRKVQPSEWHKARASAAEAEKQLQWSEPMWNRLISPRSMRRAARIDINPAPCTDAGSYPLSKPDSRRRISLSLTWRSRRPG